MKLAALTIASLVLAYCAIVPSGTTEAERQVYAACEMSRTSQTISEQRCAELQDYYGYEYLCDQRGTDPAIHCWTEPNPQLQQDNL